MPYHTIEHMRGKRVLELGCGVGYLGLVVAAIQLSAPDSENFGSSVWLTDVNEVVLSRCMENVNLTCSELRGPLISLNFGVTR
jgi:16S rRNA G1207 methylase RsmC